MDKFSYMYDEMTKNYEKISRTMSEVYKQIQEQPENKQLQNILASLGETAEGMLNQQLSFTDAYCPNDIKRDVMNNLFSKKEALLSALNQDLKGRTK